MRDLFCMSRFVFVDNYLLRNAKRLPVLHVRPTLRNHRAGKEEVRVAVKENEDNNEV